MNPTSRRFWIVTLATVVTMGVTASLGRWQLGRADQKIALQARIEQQSRLAPLSQEALLNSNDLDGAVHRRVTLRGQWIAQDSLFLDNRQMNGRTGFFLLTPLRLEGSERVIMVQRGWAPRDFMDRSRVPTVPTPEGPVELQGRLAPAPGKLFQMGDAGAGPIRQNVDIQALAQEFALPLMPVSVLQTEGPADGLQRHWPRVTVDVQKHYGYAFQWFGMCALAGVLYLWFQLISPRRKSSRHGPEA